MKSDLPNSSQFSPTQTPLPDLLAIVAKYEPDRQATQVAIVERFFADRKAKTPWDWKLADNTVIAMSQYLLVNKPASDVTHVSLTDLGRSLSDKASVGDFDGLYDEFAVHILLNLRGLEVIAVVDDLVAAGEVPTKATIVKELKSRGIYHPPNGTHLNGMRQWLEMAGLVHKGQWVADARKLQSLLGGTSLAEIDEYAALTPPQRAFALALARLDVPEAISSKVARYAEEIYGVEFPEGGLPQSTLFALRDVGLIETEKTTTGQGAKPYIVRPTEKLRNELLEPIFTSIEGTVGIQYRNLIRMSFSSILDELKSSSTHVKGLALEALAFYVARLLNLEFVKWRLRSSRTGGAELDVVMEGAQLIFSRWQIQCKNSTDASLDDIAKEVGVAQVIKANVVLIITTGKIGQPARQFANAVMENTNLYVALIDGSDILRIAKEPTEIVEIMLKQSRGAMVLKKGQVIV